jgi:uncharacterized membrane protein (UPF0127 family)
MKNSKKIIGFKDITFSINGKKYTLNVRPCKTLLSKFRGLMFNSNPLNLLFMFNKEKTLSIHSFFCKPFIAIWLDKDFIVTKLEEVKKTKINISGKGKYLIEIPSTNKSYEFYRRVATKHLNTK